MNRIGKQQQARIEKWLAKETHSEEELAEGAMMVLQCNRNRAMYNTITRRLRHFEEKIAYELRKHLSYMADGLNLDEVKEMEAKVLPAIGKAIDETERTADEVAKAMGEVPQDSILPSPAYDAEDGKQTDAIVARGKRTDHDSLPEEIKDIWEKNAERYKKIKQAHETCKTLTAACDRYEYTKAIAELWADYKKDFDTYDHYVDDKDRVTEKTGTDAIPELTAMDMQAIKLARAYMAKNMPRLEKLVKASKKEGFTDDQRKELEEWRTRIQERADIIVRTRQVITDEYRARLTKAGIELGTASDE